MPSPILRILFVDNDITDTHALAEKLEASTSDFLPQLSCVFFVVNDAFMALECTQHSRYDLIIANHQLPNFQAVEMFSSLRRVGCRVPFVLLLDSRQELIRSAKSIRQAKEQLNIFALLMKPLIAKDLCRVIERAASDLQFTIQQTILSMMPYSTIEDTHFETSFDDLIRSFSTTLFLQLQETSLLPVASPSPAMRKKHQRSTSSQPTQPPQPVNHSHHQHNSDDDDGKEAKRQKKINVSVSPEEFVDWMSYRRARQTTRRLVANTGTGNGTRPRRVRFNQQPLTQEYYHDNTSVTSTSSSSSSSSSSSTITPLLSEPSTSSSSAVLSSFSSEEMTDVLNLLSTMN